MKRFSAVLLTLLFVAVATVAAAYLMLPGTTISQRKIPEKTAPQLFAVVQDTDGNPQTPSNTEGIIVDSNGTVYISLVTERAVVNINQNDGAQHVLARIPGDGSLLGLAVDSENNIYVADANFGDPQARNSNRIYKITQTGEVSVFASGIPAPNGLIFDRDGNLLVTSITQGASYKVDKNDGNVTLFSDNDLLKGHNPQFPYGANGIAVTKDGATIYVANYGDANIIRIRDGNTSIFGEENGFPGADGLTLDSAGNLYIAQNIANTISALTPDGTKIIIAQNNDSTGSNGELEAPASLVFYQDNLYITNTDYQMGTNTKTEPPYAISLLTIGIPGQQQ
jgi:sugar lactone lactonase YvrE